MEKEKQIEDLAKYIAKYICPEHHRHFDLCDNPKCGSDNNFECCVPIRKAAINLINAGYGNVKEAVKDFAEKLKKKFIRLEKKYGDEADRDKNTIPNLQFEFYKPVVEREVAFANGQATMANKAQDFIDELIKEVCGD